MCLRVIWYKSQELLVSFDCCFEFPLFMGDFAQDKNGIGALLFAQYAITSVLCPLQVAFLLSTPGSDFTGGEFVLTEQRPRMQSRVQVVPLRQGDGVIFPVRNRPVRSKRGAYRVNVRHGVSQVRSGHRQTLGIIFHDAE